MSKIMEQQSTILDDGWASVRLTKSPEQKARDILRRQKWQRATVARATMTDSDIEDEQARLQQQIEAWEEKQNAP